MQNNHGKKTEWIWTPDRIETNQMKRNANKNFQCHNEKQEIEQKK